VHRLQADPPIDGAAPAYIGEPQTHYWMVSGSAAINEVYERGNSDLMRLYHKAKASQWNAETDVDWSYELNPENPLNLHDATLLIYGTPLWDRLDEAAKTRVRQHSQAWTLSQILHGEQAALLCAARLAQAEETLPAKLCAAAQVIDEARHVEAYSRLIHKMAARYPMSPSLKALLQDTVTCNELDITNLGMQILVEGVALAIFHMIVAYSRDPFVKSLVSRIQRDEARHFAIGRITLEPLYRDMCASQRRVREEFVCQGAVALFEHLCADDIWEPIGLSPKECKEAVRDSPLAHALRRNLFRRLVPSIRDMSLLTPKVRATFAQLGVLDYEHLPNRTN
jgi:hypothetical protein